MKSRRITFAVAVLALLFSLAAVAAEPLPVRGRVVDPTGRAISGIKVHAIFSIGGAEPKSYEKGVVKTASDGSFAFTLNEPSQPCRLCLIAFDPDKYLGWAGVPLGKNWQTQVKPQLIDVKLIVSQPKPVEGRVVDEKGLPISGVKVICRSFFAKDTKLAAFSHMDAESLTKIFKVGELTTDSDGRFRIAGIPEHVQAYIQAKKEHLAMKPRQYDEALDLSKMVMVPGGKIVGRLVDSEGKAFAGELITASDQKSRGSGSDYSSKDGSFEISGLVPGTYEISFYGSKAYPLTLVATSAGVGCGKTTNVGKIALPKLVSITGRVIDVDTGKPIANAEVFAYAEKWRCTSASSDSHGVFELSGLPGGCRMYYSGGNPHYFADIRSAPVPVTISDTGLKDYVIKLKKADTANGTVVGADGKPVAGAIVSIGDPTSGTFVRTSAEGKFTVMVPQEQQGGG